jgi:hypothetical protein
MSYTSLDGWHSSLMHRISCMAIELRGNRDVAVRKNNVRFCQCIYSIRSATFLVAMQLLCLCKMIDLHKVTCLLKIQMRDICLLKF